MYFLTIFNLLLALQPLHLVFPVPVFVPLALCSVPGSVPKGQTGTAASPTSPTQPDTPSTTLEGGGEWDPLDAMSPDLVLLQSHRDRPRELEG